MIWLKPVTDNIAFCRYGDDLSESNSVIYNHLNKKSHHYGNVVIDIKFIFRVLIAIDVMINA